MNIYYLTQQHKHYKALNGTASIRAKFAEMQIDIHTMSREKLIVQVKKP